MFEKSLWEQFKTNRFERIATLCLTGAIVIGLVGYNYIRIQNVKTEKTNPELAKLLEDYYANKPEEKKSQKKVYNRKPQKSWQQKKPLKSRAKIVYSLFQFDPNKVDYDDLIKLSFTSKQANTLLKFRTSGFTFKTSDDLDKVHGLDSDLLSKIKPYVTIAISTKKANVYNNTSSDSTANIVNKTVKPIERIEINTATHKELIAIYGIGKTYANIIINYRDKLGGYIDLSQLAERYNFPDTAIHVLQKSLTIDTTIRQKLDINKVSFKELLAHPYIDYEQNQILFPFIKNRRPITDLSILKDIMVLDTSVVNKLMPYLKIE